MNKSAAGSLSVVALLSGQAANSITIPLNISGTAVLGTDASTSANSITVAPMATSGSITVSAINDSQIAADKAVVLGFGTLAGVSAGTTSSTTVTIVNDLIHPFTIAGVSSTTNPTASAILIGTPSPTVQWSSADNATSYDVTVYANDGTTVACSVQNATSLTLAPTSCTLTQGLNYKLVVVAKEGTGRRAASNSPFTFMVNSNPTPAPHGPYYVMKGSSFTITTATLLATDVDPDAGQTPSLTITAAAGSVNSTATLSSGTITYTPESLFTGSDAFTYTLQDASGGTATGTVNISVVTATTWTGKANTVDFSNAGNWCGSVNTAKTGCNGTGTAPSSGDIAIFDGTCRMNCSASLSTSISVGGLALNRGFSGILLQGAGTGYAITIGGSGFAQSAGTFTGGSDSININGPFALSGGTFTSTTGSWRVASNVTITNTPTFSANSGTFTWGNAYGYKTMTPGTVQFNNFILEGGGYDWDTFTGTTEILGDLSTSNSDSRVFMNGGTINVHGNTNFSNYGYAGSSLIRMVGAGNQTIAASLSGSNIPGMEIASTGGTVTITGAPTFQGQWVVTSGTIDPSGASITLGNSSSSTLNLTPGDFSYHDFAFVLSAYSGYNLNGTLKVNGSLDFNYFGSNSGLYGGTIEARGNVSSETGPMNSSSALKILGNGNQSISTNSGGAGFVNIEIASTGGTVTFVSDVLLAGNFTYTSGTVSFGTVRTTFTGSGTISPGSLNFYDVSIASGVAESKTFNSLTASHSLSLTVYDGRSSIFGTISFAGNYAQAGTPVWGFGLNLNLNDSNVQTITLGAGDSMPSGSITVNNSSAAGVSFLSDVSAAGAWHVQSGGLHMNGHNFTAPSISLSSTSIYLQDSASSPGTLTVGGTIYGTGPAFSGTIQN